MRVNLKLRVQNATEPAVAILVHAPAFAAECAVGRPVLQPYLENHTEIQTAEFQARARRYQHVQARRSQVELRETVSSFDHFWLAQIHSGLACFWHLSSPCHVS